MEVEAALKSRLQLPSDLISSILTLIRQRSEAVTPANVDESLCRDPNDLHVLGAALSGQADVIATGDKDLLVVERIDSTPILTPCQFCVSTVGKAGYL